VWRHARATEKSTKPPMIFSTLLPSQDAPSIWSLQNRLLIEAQRALGEKDPAKKIYQPVFATDGKGPRVINTPNLDGAFATLSANAASYWPTAVYELAHETVHLLNPIAGYTNYLEEGVAVAFSLHAQDLYGLTRFNTTIQSYIDAVKLTEPLPGGTLDFGRAVRRRFGCLHGFNAAQLHEAFPAISAEIASQLTTTCVPW
jgi:hypothetical protein